MYLLDRSLIDNSTLLLNKRNLYKYDIIIIIPLLNSGRPEHLTTNNVYFWHNHWVLNPKMNF